jgi:hypothetical protein
MKIITTMSVVGFLCFHTVSIAQNLIPSSCTPLTTFLPNDQGYGGIIKVVLNDLVHISQNSISDNASNGYMDFTSSQANLVTGTSYTGKISTFNMSQYAAVYIDFNNNGYFDESPITGSNPLLCQHLAESSFTFTVPTTCTLNTKLRMRVISEGIENNNSPGLSPCMNLTYGQAEDYAVYITQGASNLVPSVSIISNAEGNTVDDGSSITFTASSLNGCSPDYRWFVNGSQVNGATAQSFTSSTLLNGQIVSCEIISKCSGITGTTAMSNSIYVTVKETMDVGIVAMPFPRPGECSNFSPAITVRNNGARFLQKLTVKYYIDNDNIGVTHVWTGASVPQNQSVTIELPMVNNSPAGNHMIRYEIENPNDWIDVSPVDNIFSISYSIISVSVPEGNANQSFCLGATVASLSADGTSVQWFATAVGNSSPLPSTLSLTNTDYYASQLVNGCESSSRLKVSVQIKNPPAPTGIPDEYFCGDAIVSDLTAAGDSLKWYVTATGGASLPALTQLISGNQYYGSHTVDGCESSQRLLKRAILNPLPNAPIGSISQSLCSPSTVVNLLPAGSDIRWYTQANGGLALPNSEGVENGIYYASRIIENTGCESGSRFKLKVELISTPKLMSRDYLPFCTAGTISDLGISILSDQNATGVNWYTGLTSTAPLPLSTTLTNNTSYYGTQIVNGCESEERLVVTIVFGSVEAPADIPQSFCGPTILANLQVEGSNIRWYTNALSSSPLSISTNLVSGQTYYASQTVNGCESLTRLAKLFTIQPIPEKPNGLSLQNHCYPATVASLQPAGDNILWYMNSTSTTPLSDSSLLLNGQIYFASQVDLNSGCESTDRFSSFVSLNSPSKPNGGAEQVFCFGSSVGDLMAEGTAVKWYSLAIGGIPLESTFPLVNGTIYFASQTLLGCESAERFAAEVAINIPPPPSGTGFQSFCTAASIGDLVVEGLEVVWYSSENDEVPLANSFQLVHGSTYFASQLLSGCESVERFSTLVSVNNPSQPIGPASQSFCSESTVGDLMADGFAINWYSSENDEVPLPSTLPLVNGAAYYASQTVSYCESTERYFTIVSVNSPSAPSGSPSQTVCLEGTIGDLMLSDTVIKWYGSEYGEDSLQSTFLLVNGTTYYASQIVDGCESTQRFAVSVWLSEVLSPTGSGIQSFCNAGTVADLVVNGTDIQWFSVPSGGVALELTVPLVHGASYYASQREWNCKSKIRLVVLVTLSPNPEVSLAAFPQFCSGDPATILTQGVPAGGVYSGIGVVPNSDIFDPLLAGIGIATISYSFVDSNSCQGTAVDDIIVQECADLVELNKLDHLIYPNPTNHLLTIQSHNQAITTIQLFDIAGNLVDIEVNSGSENEMHIDVSNFEEGNYLLQLESCYGIIHSNFTVKK